jgi:hypothetical protein
VSSKDNFFLFCFQLQKITERGLRHLEQMCPRLQSIRHGSGNILFQRNTESGSFLKL